jgi:DNA-binding response OmpR family regulator
VAAAVWPSGGPDQHAIDVHIHRLRPRLREVGLVIHTLRGRGFLLETLRAG